MPGPGGSRKGKPNLPKQTLIQRLRKEFPGYHAVVELARIGMDPKNSVEVRLNAHREVAKYITPQLKSIEHSGGDTPIQHVISANPLTLEEWEKQQAQEPK